MSYVTTDKPFTVSLGYAPLPVHVLAPKTLGPMSSRRKLIKYVESHKEGHAKEVLCLDRSDAMRVCDAFSVPSGNLWFKLVMENRGEGVPENEVYWKAGVVA